ncbi:MAG: UxaA family hydrolase, partial [Planctomycetaceae bacterium]|nr:UxaA family hydrolase [Planctomycetaceae bacterium]
MATTTDCPLVRLHPDDNVAIAKRSVGKNVLLTFDHDGSTLTTQDAIDLGHKMALVPIAKGQPVRKFGQMIGYANSDIAPGEWVHSHNLGIGELNLDYAYSSDVPPDPEPITGRTFLGFRRKDGRSATRNYIGLVSTVNCSATTSKYVAQAISPLILDQFPNIDGIVPLVHKGGCAMEYEGEDHQQLARTLAGFARHPNIAAYLVLGLGCETAQASFMVNSHDLVQLDTGEGNGQKPDEWPLVMNIQDHGGVRKTVDRAIGILKEMLPMANQVERVPIPVAELILGTECGGSDGNSGVTANPAVGI